MGMITVRNLPAALIRAIKAAAKAHGRSMEQEVRAILQSVATDRKSACEQVERAWSRQKRPTRRAEVDNWIRQSRP